MARISVITSLYRCIHYLNDYFDAVEKVVNKEECEFLLIFNDPTPEEVKIVDKRIKRKSYFRFISVERESLYASWNRGIRLASSNYIANWNVDDVREPDSLVKQADALDENPEVAIAYGDTISVSNYGEKEGRLNHELKYNITSKSRFKNSFFISCFPMWRKSIHEKIGYFDEQFKLVGDFDFQIRVAFYYDFIKVDGILGYFLAGGGGLRLSQQIKTHMIEDNAVYLRYGVYSKVNICYLRYRRLINIDFVKRSNKFIPLNKYLPGISEYKSKKRNQWVKNIFLRFPIDSLRYFKTQILSIPTRTS